MKGQKGGQMEKKGRRNDIWGKQYNVVKRELLIPFLPSEKFQFRGRMCATGNNIFIRVFAIVMMLPDCRRQR